ncbi:MAG: ZIP family metal transporter [Candidatus Omnitrophica bacterium]|nr:ZIP family metal transporter [Candidatus Omnitrophota bacterium]
MTQLLLGLLAGGTIFLSLPVARIKRVNEKTKGFLNAISTGILIFLLVEITGHLLEEIEDLLLASTEGRHTLPDVFLFGGLLLAGFSIGLLSLVFFEQRYLGLAKNGIAPKQRAHQIATLIAIGLGLHNFSEGLAIGQGYASGAVRLAWLLAIGFALHNATEGFGIAAPLAGHQASWGFIGRAGLIAGGPTCLGAIVGGVWVNQAVEVFCLSLAAGTLLYVIGELLHLGRHLKAEGEVIVELGLLVGFFVALVTDFLLLAAGGGS